MNGPVWVGYGLVNAKIFVLYVFILTNARVNTREYSGGEWIYFKPNSILNQTSCIRIGRRSGNCVKTVFTACQIEVRELILKISSD